MNNSDSDSPADEICIGEWSSRNLSRREFAALTVAVGASLAAFQAASQVLMAPPNAPGLSFDESDVDIKTPDGVCDAAFIRPATGAHPGVILWPDAPSLREALRLYGRRLAAAGYAVVIPNVFYRAFRAPLWDGPINMSPEFNAKMVSGIKTTSEQTYRTDANAIMAFMESQPSVSKDKKMGVVGYCMGGPPTMRTAAWFPDRIGAAAIFHGLEVTDKPDSPHLLIPKIKARVYIAIAETDDMQAPTAKEVARAAFAASKNPATIEVYKGTAHAWTIPDIPPMGGPPGFDGKGHYAQPGHMIYDPAQAERAFAQLLALYKSALT